MEVLSISIVGVISAGFSLYKKIKEKGKYIELIENAKKELITSCTEVKRK